MSTERRLGWRRALLGLGVAIAVLGLPWAIHGYMRWWELAFNAKCGTVVEIVLPRAK